MSAFTGYLAAGATLLSWTIGTFAFTEASKRSDPASVNRVRLLYAFLILSFGVSIFMQKWPWQLFSGLSVQQLIWFGFSGFIGLTLGDYFAFTAYRILGSRRASLFGCFAPGAALMAAMLLLDEHIGWNGILGMVVSVAGIMLLVLSRREKQQVQLVHDGNYYKGILFAALGAVCQGAGLVLAKQGFALSNPDFSAVYATWTRMLAASSLAYVIGIFKLNVGTEFSSITFNRHKVAPVLLGTIFGPVIGVSFSLVTAMHLEASVAQTLFSLLPVTVLITSVLLYKEKVHFSAYLAVAVSLAGVLLLVWRDRW